MRDAFIERIWDSMSKDKSVFFVSADFGSPVLDKIRRDFPDRFVNVGIAEQNLINITAGLALEGYRVFAYAIAPFITMRCFEQIRVSLALLSEVRPMNVNLIGVGAGYSYVVSGPTHQCYEDITLMRALPNFHVLSPADHVTATALFDQCQSICGPKYLRFDAQVLPIVYENQHPDVAQGFNILKRGRKICLVATGFMVHTALKVAEVLSSEGIEVGIIDLFNLSRFSEAGLIDAFMPYQALVSLEEGFQGRGGLDALLSEFIRQQSLDHQMLNIGVEAAYHFELGTRDQLHEHVGIGPKAVTKRIHAFLNSLLNQDVLSNKSTLSNKNTLLNKEPSTHSS